MSIRKHSDLPDHAYINAFNLIPGIGTHKLHMLSHYFNSFADAWHAPVTSLMQAGLSEKISYTISSWRTKIDPTMQWNLLTDAGIHLVTITELSFPQNITHIDHVPFCLYVRGDLSLFSQPSVAIVGSRKISDYGTRATTFFVDDLVHHGCVIISGLALGTDSCAHRATLAAGGKTIAVVAGGVDDASISPHAHLSLVHKILDSGGSIVSEYPIGTTPNRGTFPARNRLMAGLADVVLIIEAAKNSGTLITADHAHAFKKPLFALPGSIFSQTAYGTNALVRNGTALPLFHSNDVLQLLFHEKHIIRPQKDRIPSLNDPDQEMLYAVILDHDDTGIQINTIIKETPLDTTTVSTTLTMLEIDGLIKNIGNQTYITTQK